MRRWLAILIGTAAIAVAATAMALTGPETSGDQAPEAHGEVEAEPAPTTKPIEFEEIPPGMLGDDPLPKFRPVVVKAEKTPVDETPPEIEILHPVDGQVFETKEVVFEGKTEPGARVLAGDYEAEVNGEGGWRIVLFLGKGENVVTIKALDAAGNSGTDSVTVSLQTPEKPKAEAPKQDKPKAEEPKKEEPKKEEPKEEQPKEEEPHEWEFVAKQAYGECSETPPYDVFYGKGKPGTKIHIESAYGSGVAEVGEKGGWEVKVFFESAPVGEVFVVKLKDEFGNYKKFEFVHTA